MKYDDINKKTISELYEMYGNLKKEQLNLRIQRSQQVLKNSAQMRHVRRDIARIRTKLTALKQSNGG